MSEPIRILQMIGSLNVGGSQTMIINLHKAIDKSVVQFDYIIDHPDHLYFAQIVKDLGGKIFVLPTFTGFNFFEIKRAWKKFFYDHPEYKILHSHVRSYASLYLPIAKKMGLKTIVHSHNTSNGKGLGALIKKMMQYPLRYQADYLFGCSREAGEWLFGRDVVNSSKYVFLQNAIDSKKYRFDEAARKAYRLKLGLENKKTFIHVGRFHPAKNHLFLLDIFESIHKSDENTVLLLAGDGELRLAIEQKILELNLKDCVVLLGNRDDIPQLMHAADCFLFPSLWEGLPVTVVEAQAAGLPCYVSETISKDVKISDLVTYLPVNSGTMLWTNAVMHGKRRDVLHEIEESGFDIEKSSKKLTEFYLSL